MSPLPSHPSAAILLYISIGENKYLPSAGFEPSNSDINAIVLISLYRFNKSKYNIFDNIKINTSCMYCWLSNETMMTKIGQVVFEKIAGKTEPLARSFTQSQVSLLLTHSLPDTPKGVNYSTVYNDMLVASNQITGQFPICHSYSIYSSAASIFRSTNTYRINICCLISNQLIAYRKFHSTETTLLDISSWYTLKHYCRRLSIEQT